MWSHSEGQICSALVSHLQIIPFISQKLISQAVTWIWTRWEIIYSSFFLTRITWIPSITFSLPKWIGVTVIQDGVKMRGREQSHGFRRDGAARLTGRKPTGEGKGAWPAVFHVSVCGCPCVSDTFPLYQVWSGGSITAASTYPLLSRFPSCTRFLSFCLTNSLTKGLKVFLPVWVSWHKMASTTN